MNALQTAEPTLPPVWVYTGELLRPLREAVAQSWREHDKAAPILCAHTLLTAQAKLRELKRLADRFETVFGRLNTRIFSNPKASRGDAEGAVLGLANWLRVVSAKVQELHGYYAVDHPDLLRYLRDAACQMLGELEGFLHELITTLTDFPAWLRGHPRKAPGDIAINLSFQLNAPPALKLFTLRLAEIRQETEPHAEVYSSSGWGAVFLGGLLGLSVFDED